MGQTFSFKPVDLPAAAMYLSKFASKFDFSNLPPTTTQSIFKYLRWLHDTRPGPNGIPYSAYLSAGPVAWSLAWPLDLSQKQFPLVMCLSLASRSSHKIEIASKCV